MTRAPPQIFLGGGKKSRAGAVWWGTATPKECPFVNGIRWFVRDYVSRHRHPWNVALHLVGVPLAPFGVLMLLIVGELELAGVFFVAGYLLQWAGHTIEGNEVGEWILIKYLARRATGTPAAAKERA
jgi:hypothetical protein